KDVEEKEATRLVSHDIESKNGNDSLEGGDQMHPIDEAEDVEKEATTEVGKVSMQEECCGDDVNEKTQMILSDEAKDVEEKGIGLVSQNVERKLENDSLEGDANESDINMENQMHPKPEEEGVEEKATTELGKVSMQEECRGDEVKDVEEKATGLTSHNISSKLENDTLEGDANVSDISMENQMHRKSEDGKEKATTERGKVSMQEEGRSDDVKEKIQMIPTDEAKHVEEKVTGLISYNVESKPENDTLEGDNHESDINMENQMHPIDETEDVEEKAIGMVSDHTRSSLQNDLLKDKDDLEIAAGLSYDGETSELEDEDKKDGNTIIPFMNGIDFQGKTTILASDDPLFLRNSFGGEESVGNSAFIAVLPHPPNCGIRVAFIATSNTFIVLGEEMVQVIQPEKSPYSESVEGENCESLPSSSFESNEEYEKQEDSCLRRNPSVTYNHNLNDESSIKQDEGETSVLTLNAANASNDSELQELLQGNESLLKDTLPNADSHFQQIKHDGSEKDMEYQEKLLCENKSDERDENEFVNNMIDTSENNNIEDSINSNHEENCKVLNEENKFSRSGSTNENPRDCKQDQCIVELKESNGDCNGETHTILDSSIFGIANNDQIEEDNVTENGFLFDAYVSNSIKVSDENASPEEEKSVVPEVEESTVVAETNMLEQCSSDMITINQEETFSLQNSSSLLHIYSYNHGNVEQTESFTVASMPKSGRKQANSIYFCATVDLTSFVRFISTDIFNFYFLCGLGGVGSLGERREQQRAKLPRTTKRRGTTSLHKILRISNVVFHSLGGPETLACSCSQHSAELSNSSLFANGGYETRDSVTRLSTESNPDDKNITCHMQKSPSFNLNLRIEAKQEESDQIPLLRESANDSLSNKASLNLSNSMPHDEYDHIEEKIVTMERSYSEVSKSSFIGFLKEEEEARLLVMEQTQDNNVGSKVEVKVVSSSTSPKGKDRRNFRSFFFTNCMCCATVPN
ncbi:hypothetical protein L195_g016371, partial [Trifolium pratense]